MIAPKKPRSGRSRVRAELKDTPFVHLDGIYSLTAVMSVTGMGEDAMASARAAGLRVRRSFGRVFITGRDFLHYLDAQDRGPSDRN